MVWTGYVLNPTSVYIYDIYFTDSLQLIRLGS